MAQARNSSIQEAGPGYKMRPYLTKQTKTPIHFAILFLLCWESTLKSFILSIWSTTKLPPLPLTQLSQEAQDTCPSSPLHTGKAHCLKFTNHVLVNGCHSSNLGRNSASPVDIYAVHKVFRRHTLTAHGGQGSGPRTTHLRPLLT